MVSYVNSGHRRYLAIINEVVSWHTQMSQMSNLDGGEMDHDRSLSWWGGRVNLGAPQAHDCTHVYKIVIWSILVFVLLLNLLVNFSV